jgi:hypothetical protein
MLLRTDALAAEHLLDKIEEHHEHCESALGTQLQFF